MSRRWSRILIGLGVTVLVSGLYAWFFGFQTMMILGTRKIARKSAIGRQIQIALTDTYASQDPGTKLSYFGYDFEVPWDDLDQAKTKVYPNRVVLGFRSGKSLMFAKAPPRYFVNAVLDQMDKESFRNVCGDAALQSDYAMWSLILETTPDKVTVFSSRQDTVTNSMLVLLKFVAIP